MKKEDPEPEQLNVYQKAFRALLLPISDPGHVCNKDCPCYKKKKVVKHKGRR